MDKILLSTYENMLKEIKNNMADFGLNNKITEKTEKKELNNHDERKNEISKELRELLGQRSKLTMEDKNPDSDKLEEINNKIYVLSEERKKEDNLEREQILINQKEDTEKSIVKYTKELENLNKAKAELEKLLKYIELDIEKEISETLGSLDENDELKFQTAQKLIYENKINEEELASLEEKIYDEKYADLDKEKTRIVAQHSYANNHDWKTKKTIKKQMLTNRKDVAIDIQEKFDSGEYSKYNLNELRNEIILERLNKNTDKINKIRNSIKEIDEIQNVTKALLDAENTKARIYDQKSDLLYASLDIIEKREKLENNVNEKLVAYREKRDSNIENKNIVKLENEKYINKVYKKITSTLNVGTKKNKDDFIKSIDKANEKLDKNINELEETKAKEKYQNICKKIEKKYQEEIKEINNKIFKIKAELVKYTVMDKLSEEDKQKMNEIKTEYEALEASIKIKQEERENLLANEKRIFEENETRRKSNRQIDNINISNNNNIDTPNTHSNSAKEILSEKLSDALSEKDKETFKGVKINASKVFMDTLKNEKTNYNVVLGPKTYGKAIVKAGTAFLKKLSSNIRYGKANKNKLKALQKIIIDLPPEELEIIKNAISNKELEEFDPKIIAGMIERREDFEREERARQLANNFIENESENESENENTNEHQHTR